MKKDSIYYRQVQLLVRVLPLLDSEQMYIYKNFILKTFLIV